MADLLRRIWPAILALAVAQPAALAYPKSFSVDTDSNSGISIEIDEPFDLQPSSGFNVVHLKVSNATRSAHGWTIDFNDGDRSSAAWHHREQFAAGPGEEREIDLFVPEPTLFTQEYGWTSRRASVSGYGSSGKDIFLAGGYPGGAPTAYILMSETLASDVWSKLEAEIGKTTTFHDKAIERVRFGGGGITSRKLYGSAVKLSELPADSRTFSGAAGLWLSEQDWRSLDAPLHAAIGQWLFEGGNLFVACKAAPSSPLPDLPQLTAYDTSVPVGLGRARIVRMQDRELDVDTAAKDILGLDASPFPPWREDFRGWPLAASVGLPAFNVAAVITFVVLFAILIGPGNLIWFASARRRHRLFLTIPLMSGGGSIVLFLWILLGDGIGGIGGRNVFVLMSAGENRITATQEQVTRTRFLFDRSFQLPEDAVFASVQENGSGAVGQLERTGNKLSGNWFRSRKTQTQALRLTMPSRASVALQAPQNGAPVLLSTADSVFRDLFYLDDSARYWRVQNLAPGRPAPMQAATKADFAAWRSAVSGNFSQNLIALVEQVADRPGYFYGVAEAMPEAPIATLPSIHWDHETIFCCGSCTPKKTR